MVDVTQSDWSSEASSGVSTSRSRPVTRLSAGLRRLLVLGFLLTAWVFALLATVDGQDSVVVQPWQLIVFCGFAILIAALGIVTDPAAKHAKLGGDAAVGASSTPKTQVGTVGQGGEAQPDAESVGPPGSPKDDL